MSTEARRVLVTGASGFIGRRCVAALARSGYAVHAVSSRPHAADSCATWHRYDLLDPGQCATAVAQVRPTHLLHLAWTATPGTFWSSPKNLDWLSAAAALFGAFYAQGGQRAVGVGTCAEYAWSEAPYREGATPEAASTVYGLCKRAAALALEAAALQSGRSAAWARLFFPYGPGEAPERLLPYVIRCLLKGEPALCTSGEQYRDFIHVDDVAAALVALLQAEATGTYNVGSGVALRLKDAVAQIAELLDGAALVRHGARDAPAGDPQYVVADVTRLTAATGWRPAVDFRRGIAASIAYWKAEEAAKEER